MMQFFHPQGATLQPPPQQQYVRVMLDPMQQQPQPPQQVVGGTYFLHPTSHPNQPQTAPQQYHLAAMPYPQHVQSFQPMACYPSAAAAQGGGQMTAVPVMMMPHPIHHAILTTPPPPHAVGDHQSQLVRPPPQPPRPPPLLHNSSSSARLGAAPATGFHHPATSADVRQTVRHQPQQEGRFAGGNGTMGPASLVQIPPAHPQQAATGGKAPASGANPTAFHVEGTSNGAARRAPSEDGQQPSERSKSGGPATSTSDEESNLVEVYAPQFTALYKIPAEDVYHLPAAHHNVTRLTLCSHFTTESPCALGNRCKFVHADLGRATVIPSIHVNYAYRSLDEVKYQRFPPGYVLRVSQPNGKPPVMCIASDYVLRTKAAFTTHQQRILSHCAHYYFSRTCHLGSQCHFVHAVFIDPSASSPYQRAPVPNKLPQILAAVASAAHPSSAVPTVPAHAASSAQGAPVWEGGYPSVVVGPAVTPHERMQQHVGSAAGGERWGSAAGPNDRGSADDFAHLSGITNDGSPNAQQGGLSYGAFQLSTESGSNVVARVVRDVLGGTSATTNRFPTVVRGVAPQVVRGNTEGFLTQEGDLPAAPTTRRDEREMAPLRVVSPASAFGALAAAPSHLYSLDTRERSAGRAHPPQLRSPQPQGRVVGGEGDASGRETPSLRVMLESAGHLEPVKVAPQPTSPADDDAASRSLLCRGAPPSNQFMSIMVANSSNAASASSQAAVAAAIGRFPIKDEAARQATSSGTYRHNPYSFTDSRTSN